MSEATRKLRSIEAHTTSVCGVRDLAADAIEAVEAQVAEAVARVAALEKMGRLGASPNGDDRTRGGMPPRGFDSPTPAAPTPAAPSAVPAPRGFRVGDKVRTGGLSPFDAVVVEVREPQHERLNVKIKAERGVYWWHGPDLTLVRAAAAPEAPAEEDTGLVVQRIRDEATKPLHVEIEKLRGEVARLTKERDEARAISAVTAERVRNETQIATELRKDLADARDRIASKDRSIEVMLAETRALREALDAERSGVATKLHDAGFNNVENLVGAYRFERAQADALRAKLVAAEQALDVERRTGTDANGNRVVCATREELDAKVRKSHAELAAAQGEMRSLRATMSVLRADLAALKGQRDAQTRSYDRVAAECDALRLASLTWFNAAGEPEILATAEEVTERRKAAAKELAALRAKPRFRMRKVTKADVEEFIAHDGSFYESLRALGFRRRVDGAK